jgi:hypothetical protein
VAVIASVSTSSVAQVTGTPDGERVVGTDVIRTGEDSYLVSFATPNGFITLSLSEPELGQLAYAMVEAAGIADEDYDDGEA